jgi:mono/diheme cytochrome c family protein
MFASKRNFKLMMTLLALSLMTIVLFINTNTATAVEDAASVYKAKCAICHGMDGSGNTANGKKLNVKDLRRDEVKKMSDAQLLEIIGHGKNKMPAYEAVLGKEKVNLMVGYTRTFAK